MKLVRSVLVAASAATLVLTGCAQSPTAAAIVGGTALTESEVDQAFDSLVKLQTDPTGVRQMIVKVELVGLVAEKAAADKGIALTDSARQPLIASDPDLTQLQADPSAGPFVTRFANYALVAQTLGADGWLEACSATAMTVNPRYGAWSRQLCSLDGTSGSLSKAQATK